MRHDDSLCATRLAHFETRVWKVFGCVGHEGFGTNYVQGNKDRLEGRVGSREYLGLVGSLDVLEIVRNICVSRCIHY